MMSLLLSGADMELDGDSASSGQQGSTGGHSGTGGATGGATGTSRPAKPGDAAGADKGPDFAEKVRLSNQACENGDFKTAVALYTEVIQMDPNNHILYSNRSAALIKMGQHQRALKDALKARELAPAWPKAYYRQGVALQCLGRHADALAAFASGLAQDPKSMQLLAGLVESAMKSPLRATVEPTYRQLKAMRLDKSPFVVISVIGQELLAAGHYQAAVVVLESALRIGTCSLKLRGSVFSALSSSYWALNSLDKALSYMQQDLAVAKALGDIAGECRAHGNLGSAYFSKGCFREALTAHRYQLVLAMKCKDTQAAAQALTSLGHVYTAIGDYPNALASHKQCVQLVKQIGDKVQEAREIGNVGAVYLAMGDFDNSVQCHMEHLRIAKELGNRVEEARAYSNLGSSHHYKRNFEQAITYHNHVLRLAQECKDKAIEARAYAGLGHAARCMADCTQAKKWHEKQLDMALAMKDKLGEGRACSNLGIVYQLMGDQDAALKLHQAHLNIARGLGDRAGMGRAYGNIGNAYSAMGYYEQAIKYHKQELTISKEVNDRSSEASTHGNLAVAYQALGMHEMALLHYHSHLGIARELRDTAGEACALCNLGNCHSSRGEFGSAVPYYEQYLMLSQELHDVEGEAKACHFLGYAHYCLGNFREAIRYYEQDLALAKDLQDRMSMGRAYCNLGLAHLALSDFEKALECQKYFLAIAHMMKHLAGKFRALGNIGDVLIKMNDYEEAVKMFHKQLLLAKQSGDRALEGSAFAALGLAHRQLRQFDKALGYHTQELTVRQELNDIKGECKAHGNLGAVHMALGNYTNAMKCYEEQLERAKDLGDASVEAQVLGNLGITRLNMNHFEDAARYFQQQLSLLEQIPSPSVALDKGRSLGNLGDCFEALGEYEKAIKCQEQFLALATQVQSGRDQERAYCALGAAHKALGNLTQSLVCYEKRLVVSHELTSPGSKGSAYGDLGQIHCLLGNYEQAISCMEHQMSIARETGDQEAEAAATAGLGMVYHHMGDYQTALQYHKLDLRISETIGSASGQARAYTNIGAAYERMKNYDQALAYFEQALSISAQMNLKQFKTKSFGALGRVHLVLSNFSQAVAYFHQGLSLAESGHATGTGIAREEEARLRHRLGLALWKHGDRQGASRQLQVAAQLIENIRRQRPQQVKSKHKTKLETGIVSEDKLSLFDEQTACYQTLQKILISLGSYEEALVVAERCRTRAMVDTLHKFTGNGSRAQKYDENTPATAEQMFEVINKQKATVIYYSTVGNDLYAWLIVPHKGITKFHQVNLRELDYGDGEPERDDPDSYSRPIQESACFQKYIHSVQESLGVDMGFYRGMGIGEDGDVDIPGHWSTIDENGDKISMTDERPPGFLRMMRGHHFNSSNYSLSSLFSLGSVNGSIASGSASRPGSTRSRSTIWQGPTCLRSLYDILISPFEAHLPTHNSAPRELVLVPDGDLFLVPFPVLKGGASGGSSASQINGACSNQDYLCERFSLISAPCLTALRLGQRSRHSKPSSEISNALVVGNPRLPASLTSRFGWHEIPYAEQEANIVAEMLQTEALTGVQATKESVLKRLSEAECIHFACHLSWKFSAVALTPGEFLDSPPKRGAHGDEDSELSDSNAMAECFLTPADILQLKLSAKLVVVSSCHTRYQGFQMEETNTSTDGQAESSHNISTERMMGLVRALMAAGAQCVLLALWPVPDTPVKILLRTFYSSLLQGARVSRALSDAMQTVHHTKHFAHPANWAGFVIIGTDVKLTNKVALMGQALCQLLTSPEKCRDALRVTLHLVEKSLQRINRNHKNAMYTTQKSIENKVGEGVAGWKDLLISVGFRFEPPANGIPTSVFFPQCDPGGRLTQCSASLQALLGLSPASLQALSKLLSSPESAEDIISVVRDAVGQLALRENGMGSGSVVSMSMPASSASSIADYSDCGSTAGPVIQVHVPVNLWRVPGCHELLASLGFDLMEVGRDEVLLRTGKQANKRCIQFALQALLALFDTQEAPKSLSLDDSSSMESLDSNMSGDESSPEDEVNIPPPPPAPPAPHMVHQLHQHPLPQTSLSMMGNLTPLVSQAGLPFRAGNGPVMGQSAFSSYVKNRGEPDGRQAVSSENNKRSESDANFTPSPVMDPAGHHARYMHHASANRSFFQPFQNNSPFASSPLQASNASSPQQTPTSVATVRSLAGIERPDSSSSASSVTDWEGQATVRRAHPPVRAQNLQPFVKNPYLTRYTNAPTLKLSKKPDPVADRLSVRTRAEIGEKATPRRDRSLDRALEMVNDHSIRSFNDTFDTGARGRVRSKSGGRIDEIEQEVAKQQSGQQQQNHQPSPAKSIQDQIIATQMSRLNREFGLNDVYHDNRSIGIGMAPPLSKLLMSTTAIPVEIDAKALAADEAFSGMGKLSLNDDPAGAAAGDIEMVKLGPSTSMSLSSPEASLYGGQQFSNAPTLKLPKPDVPPKRLTLKKQLPAQSTTWNNLHVHVRQEYPGDRLMSSSDSNKGSPSTGSDISRRDDGDGRSMTDSNYSSYSPNFKPADVTSIQNLGKTLSEHQPQRRGAHQVGPARMHYQAPDEYIPVYHPKPAGATGTLKDGDFLVPQPKPKDFHVPSLAAFNPAYEDEVDAVPSVSTTKLNPSQANEIAEYLDKVIGSGSKSSNVSEKSYSTGSTTITAGAVLDDAGVESQSLNSAESKDSRRASNAIRKASSKLTSGWSKGFKVFSQHNQS